MCTLCTIRPEMEIDAPVDALVQETLASLVDRLDRTIQSVYENQGTPVSPTTELDSFVSTHIVEALRNTVFPAHVEAELLVLHFLFQGQDQEGIARTPNRSPMKTVGDRLETARRILALLSNMALQQPSDSPPGLGPNPGRRVTANQSDSRYAKKPRDSSNRMLHETDVRFAKGVGPKRALLLEKLGIRTIEDALWFLPWRYEDRSTPVSL